MNLQILKLIDTLAYLVQELIKELRKHDPENILAQNAENFLKANKDFLNAQEEK